MSKELRRLRDVLDMKVKDPLFDTRNEGKPVLSTVLELLQTNGKDKCIYWRELLLSMNPNYSSERSFCSSRDIREKCRAITGCPACSAEVLLSASPSRRRLCDTT